MFKKKPSSIKFYVGQEIVCLEQDGYSFGDVTAIDGDKVTVSLPDFTDIAVKRVRTEYREYTRREENGTYVRSDDNPQQSPALRVVSWDEYYSIQKKTHPRASLALRMVEVKSLVNFFFANLLDQRLDYLDRKYHEKKHQN